MMMESFGNESDEAFARRLQAQEMGAMGLRGEAQRPLIAQDSIAEEGGGEGRAPTGNPTVINARMNEASSARATLAVILLVNLPQIIAVVVVLSVHWGDPPECDAMHTVRWKMWAVLSALRMAAYSLVAFCSDHYRLWLELHPAQQERVKSVRNTIDAFGLVWFVVGNMWLFGDDSSCHPHSPLYSLCVSLLVFNYLQICLPCIVALALIPVFCLCMPCLIRLLARLQDPRMAVGASTAALDTLPEVKIDSSHLPEGQDNTCPICLSEMCMGESARVLRCSHVFHRQCCDEWLRVNASCPTCRKRVFDTEEVGDAAGGGAGGAGSVTIRLPGLTLSTHTAGGGTGGTGGGAGVVNPIQGGESPYAPPGVELGHLESGAGAGAGTGADEGAGAGAGAAGAGSSTSNSLWSMGSMGLGLGLGRGVGGRGGTSGYAPLPNDRDGGDSGEGRDGREGGDAGSSRRQNHTASLATSTSASPASASASAPSSSASTSSTSLLDPDDQSQV